MKKKGFTLIELLAVIVILAIIALIAVPIVLNIIEKSKKGAAESSAYGYIDAVEKYAIFNNIDNKKYPYNLKNNTFNLLNETNGVPGLNTFIEVKGKKPTKGTITLNKKGEVTSAELGINGYKIVCSNDKCRVVGTYGQITITYNLNGGTLDKTTEKINMGDTIELPLPIPPENYVFDGWYTEENGNGEKITNETEWVESKEIYAQYIKMPTTPTIAITKNGGYPTLTNYGMVNGISNASITYDQGKYYKNLYSVDNGTTWKEYTGSLDFSSAKIMAKSVIIGHESYESSVASKSITFAIDSVSVDAYDTGSDSGTTAFYADGKADRDYYVDIDSSAIGKYVRIKQYVLNNVNYNCTMYILDSAGNALTFTDLKNNSYSTLTVSGNMDVNYLIPNNAKKIKFHTHNLDETRYMWRLYDISLANEPIINASKNYPTVTSEKIDTARHNITITYDSTSVEKLYRIGTSGDWSNYESSQKITVNRGSTLYAKGIDKNGKTTRIISSFTPSFYEDAVGVEAYDIGSNKDSTAFYADGKADRDYYVEIDSSAIGKYVRIKQYVLNNVNYNCTMYILDSAGNTLTFKNNNNTSYNSLTVSGDMDVRYLIPNNAKKIKFHTHSLGETKYIWRLYDISVIN